MCQGTTFFVSFLYYCFLVSGDSKNTSFAELTNQMSTESSTSVVQLEVSLVDDLPEEENAKEIVPKSEVKELVPHSTMIVCVIS